MSETSGPPFYSDWKWDDVHKTWVVAHQEQPTPVPTTGPSMWDLVIEDMKARDALGRERYGVPVQANNGRNSLRDVSAELLDAAVYVRQAREELKGLKADLLALVERLEPYDHNRTAVELLEAVILKYKTLLG